MEFENDFFIKVLLMQEKSVRQKKRQKSGMQNGIRMFFFFFVRKWAVAVPIFTPFIFPSSDLFLCQITYNIKSFRCPILSAKYSGSHLFYTQLWTVADQKPMVKKIWKNEPAHAKTDQVAVFDQNHFFELSESTSPFKKKTKNRSKIFIQSEVMSFRCLLSHPSIMTPGNFRRRFLETGLTASWSVFAWAGSNMKNHGMVCPPPQNQKEEKNLREATKIISPTFLMNLGRFDVKSAQLRGIQLTTAYE